MSQMMMLHLLKVLNLSAETGRIFYPFTRKTNRGKAGSILPVCAIQLSNLRESDINEWTLEVM
jgi:hypothetical protein